MASRLPDPHNLRNLAAAQPGPRIEVNRECAGCGYNLRGLPVGANCPECGMTSIVQADHDDPLSCMPVRVIFAFIRGCWLGSICVAAATAAIVAMRWPQINSTAPLVALAGVSLLWTLSAWALTPAFSIPQAASRGFSRSSRLRHLARWLQLGWVAAASSLLLKALLPSPPPASSVALLNAGLALGVAIGLAGIVILSVLLQRLSEWARDGDAERLFNWSIWILPIAAGLSLIELPSILGIAVQVMLLILWAGLAITFPWAMLSLSKSVTLSMLHSLEHRERMQRRQERTQRDDQRRVEAVARMDAAPGRRLRQP